jgi:histidine triad (HIT) family protein
VVLLERRPSVIDCIFCKIIQKRIPSQVVYEDDRCIAFHDLNPKAPVHLLIVPKLHTATLLDFGAGNKEEVVHLFWVVNKLARENKLDDLGFRTVINCKSAGGQMVYHVHIHLLGGRQMTWPPG